MDPLHVFRRMLEQTPSEAQTKVVARIFTDKKRLLDDEVLTPRRERETRTWRKARTSD